MPALSFIVMVKLKVPPITSGVPLSFPVVESNDKPGGRLPVGSPELT